MGEGGGNLTLTHLQVACTQLLSISEREAIAYERVHHTCSGVPLREPLPSWAAVAPRPLLCVA